MKSKFTPLIISLLPCTGFCALVWSDGQQCETMDFPTLSDARHAFNSLCKNYPFAVRVVNGEVQNANTINEK